MMNFLERLFNQKAVKDYLPISEVQKIEVEEGYVKPFGIRNIGNTCFMNSALQCFFSLPDFINKLDSLSNGLKNTSLLVLFSKYVQKQELNTLNKIKETVAKNNEAFRGFSQQDSFEFMVSFINSITDENEKGINKLFVGSFNSIVLCKSCLSSTFVDQTFSSIILPIKESFRIFYIPFPLKQNIIRMLNKPKVSETIKIQNHNMKKYKIGNYVLMAKLNRKYEFIDDVSTEYPYIYAFELPQNVPEGYGLIPIQLKTADKRPISSPFLCQVPLKDFEQDELKQIIIERTKEVQTDPSKFISSIDFTKTVTSFTFSEKPPLCKEYLTVIVSSEEEVNFEKRLEVTQDVEVDLIHLFNGHIRLSQLEAPCKWTCDECGKGTRAYQRIKYTKFPEILLFQMKRSSDFALENEIPDQTKVSFPEFVSFDIDAREEYNRIYPNGEGKLKYELRSISHHSGSFKGGHYWAYGKRGDDWYSFNDNSRPLLIHSQFEATSSAHVAFYEKVPEVERKTKIIVLQKKMDALQLKQDKKINLYTLLFFPVVILTLFFIWK